MCVRHSSPILSIYLQGYQIYEIQSYVTIADVFYETLPKKDSERFKSIVWLILSPYDLNDSKWSQMTPNDLT